MKTIENSLDHIFYKESKMRITPFLLLCFTLQWVAGGHQQAMAQEKKPESWQEFIAFHQTIGSFGTFTTESETKDLWEGIDAGQKYTGTDTLQLAADGKSIHSSHRMETENGDVISLGVGMSYWDARTKTIKSSNSGFDQGKLYTGSSELQSIDLDKKTIKWLYTETSQGKTTRYKSEFTQVSPNRTKRVVQKESGGEAWVEETNRVGCCNPTAPRYRIFPRLLGR